jgi:hypothetical protein
MLTEVEFSFFGFSLFNFSVLSSIFMPGLKYSTYWFCSFVKNKRRVFAKKKNKRTRMLKYWLIAKLEEYRLTRNTGRGNVVTSRRTLALSLSCAMCRRARWRGRSNSEHPLFVQRWHVRIRSSPSEYASPPPGEYPLLLCPPPSFLSLFRHVRLQRASKLPGGAVRNCSRVGWLEATVCCL